MWWYLLYYLSSVIRKLSLDIIGITGIIGKDRKYLFNSEETLELKLKLAVYIFIPSVVVVNDERSLTSSRGLLQLHLIIHTLIFFEELYS